MDGLGLKVAVVAASLVVAFVPRYGRLAAASQSVSREETQAAYPPESVVLDDEGTTNIDIWNNEFPITLDLAGSALLSKGDGIIKREQLQEIIFSVDSIRLFQGRYYYRAHAFLTNNPGKQTTVAYYYIDAYTGEVYELLYLTQMDELVPVG